MSIASMPDRGHALRWFQALSDETRLRIVELLAGGECCVCDLQDSVGAYQSRLSFHLRKLKEAGVVTDRREGRWVYYALNPDVLEGIEEFVQAVRSAPARGGCCGTSGPSCCA